MAQLMLMQKIQQVKLHFSYQLQRGATANTSVDPNSPYNDKNTAILISIQNKDMNALTVCVNCQHCAH